MKVLFLDIDGVLNSTRTATSLGGYPMAMSLNDLSKLDHVAIALVRKLCQLGNVQIVLSSSWRILHDFRELGEKLDLPIVDKTPMLRVMRGFEIQDWLAQHMDVTHYAIVDDSNDMLPSQDAHFVQTDPDEGLSWKNYQRLREILAIA